MWWNLIPLAMGAVKAQDDAEAAKAQRAVNAETARWSPWTGMRADTNVQQPSAAGTMMQAGMTSAQMYQDQQRQKAYQDYLSQQKGASPWDGMSMGQGQRLPNNYVQAGPVQPNGMF